MTFGAGDVDGVVVAQRRLGQRPGAPDVDPWRAFDRYLERLGIEQCLIHLVGLQRMGWPVRRRHQAGEDLDREMPWCNERFGGGVVSERLAGGATSWAGVADSVDDG